MGYHRAGFDVVGVDIKPQPHYPFEFHRGDAMTWPLDGYDAIHASPPCQAHTRAKHLRVAQGSSCSTPDLIAPTRARLVGAGVFWVLENVPGAPVRGVTLCGSMFSLKVRRHRLFESSALLMGELHCAHRAQGRPVGVYHRMADEVPHGGRTAHNLTEARDAMGIDWMTWDELRESIPPAYTEWIGRQLLVALNLPVAA